MLIDFVQVQKQKFENLAQNIVDRPDKYLDFDSVSDFYKAKWLNDFPQGTTWTVSGLDDGAEDFCIQIEYKNQFLWIEVQNVIKVRYTICE
ncbi:MULTISPECIES: hypothetical protein [unclassified Acinetobacter]|jgi:hypothetical protein|uniref:hypothetical protein n=1 Tax=Acinetobacter TaxID=469 RepID=UPI0018A8D8CC|nr:MULTISPECIES: hypothetical protein [unclassified Acinetobacter]MBJ9954878.1 hypothetical protein [Acinetobacter baumannii]